MRVALFVPCYVDQLRPEVGFATLDLLETSGVAVDVVDDPVCCGQPFVTAGEEARARELGRRIVRQGAAYDAIVLPSGSCTATLRRQLPRLVADAAAREVATRCVELCELLVDRALCPPLIHAVPRAIALHASCHGLRELGLGTPSERRSEPSVDPARSLLARIEGLRLVELERADECCGFGGAFAVEEEAVSARMGCDRLADQRRSGAELVTAGDVSCLLHLEGLARRREQPLRFVHVAEILAAAAFGPGHPSHDAVLGGLAPRDRATSTMGAA